MTVPNTTNKVIYTGNDNREFDYTFKILNATDLIVEQYTIATQAIETLTYETDYTLSGIDDGEEGSGTGVGDENGGKVTLTEESFPDGLSSAYKLIIRRVVSLTQETDYVENDPFPAEVHEEALDKLCMADQQLQEQVDRSIKADPTSTENLVIPKASSNKLIGWKSDGSNLENKEPLDADVLADVNESKDAALAAQVAAEEAQAIAEQAAADAADLVATALDFEIASQAEAEAGTDNTKLMTSLRTKQAITKNELVINTLTEKTTPVDDDLLVIEDSAASFAKKKVKRSKITPALGSLSARNHNTNYRAATDGFFLGMVAGDSASRARVIACSDSTCTPQTVIADSGYWIDTGFRSESAYTRGANFCIPVKKGDYYIGVRLTEGTVTNNYWWIPLGG